MSSAKKKYKREPSSPSDDLPEFARGSIVRLHMKNFMTFTDVTFLPGPRLNLLLGPNGSGKSSVVAAICLALGGKSHLVGRSSVLADFITRGEDEALLEIHIKDPQAGNLSGTRFVRRVFDVHGISKWWVDGVVAKEKDVEALRLSFDIQLDNLCQFLPQEKMNEFTELSPKELLMQTISVIGGHEWLRIHDDLLEQNKALDIQKETLTVDLALLDELKTKNHIIEHEVQSFMQRKQINQRIIKMQNFRPWIQYEHQREQANALKAQAKEYEATLKLRSTQLKDKQDPLGKLELRAKQLKDQRKNLLRKILDTENTCSALDDEIMKRQNGLETLLDSYKSIEKRAEARRAQITKLQAEIAHIQDKLATLRDIDDVKHDIHRHKDTLDVLAENLETHNNQKFELERQLRAIHIQQQQIERQLTNLNNRKRQAIQRMADHSPDVFKCYEYVSANQRAFTGRVYGPVASEVLVQDPYHAKILEAAIPDWLRRAFIVETQEDHQKLVAYTREQNWRVNIKTIPLDNTLQFESRYDLHRMKQWGVYATANDIYEAHDGVKRAILTETPLHDMMVCSEKAEDCYQQIVDENVRIWFTPGNAYSAKPSRFSNAVSFKVDDMSRKKLQNIFMGMEGSDEKKRELLDQMSKVENQYNELQNQINDVKSKMADLHSQIERAAADVRHYESERDEIKKLRDSIRPKELNITSLIQQEEKDDIAQEKKKAFDAMKQEQQALLQLIKQSFEIAPKQKALLEEQERVLLEFTDVMMEHERTSDGLNDLTKEIEHLTEQCSKSKKLFKAAVAKVAELQRVAENSMMDPGSHVQEIFGDKMPDTLDALEELINCEKDKAMNLHTATESVVDDYHRREKQIQALQQKISDKEGPLNVQRDTLDQQIQQFLAELDAKMEEMNQKFEMYCAKLHFGGELKVSNKHSIADAEIQINMQFHKDQELRSIHGGSFSGGERMIATMLYIFAMRDLSSFSFRVVDEMNQGVDEINERGLMNIMIQDAANNAAPQTMLLTPKLLPNLELNESITTHIMMNGHVDAQHWFSLLKDSF